MLIIQNHHSTQHRKVFIVNHVSWIAFITPLFKCKCNKCWDYRWVDTQKRLLCIDRIWVEDIYYESAHDWITNEHNARYNIQKVCAYLKTEVSFSVVELENIIEVIWRALFFIHLVGLVLKLKYWLYWFPTVSTLSIT